MVSTSSDEAAPNWRIPVGAGFAVIIRAKSTHARLGATVERFLFIDSLFGKYRADLR